MGYSLRKRVASAPAPEVDDERPVKVPRKHSSQTSVKAKSPKLKASSPKKAASPIRPSSPGKPSKKSLVAKKSIVKQIQQVSTAKPSIIAQQQKIATKKTAVIAQVAKRGVDKEIQSLGVNPIKRVATTHLAKGIATSKIVKRPVGALKRPSSTGKVVVKGGKITANVKKGLVNELKLHVTVKKPSVVAQRVRISQAKTVVNHELLKHVLVKEIKGKSKK